MRRLRASEAMFRSVVDSSPIAKLIVDHGGVIRFANHQAELLFRSTAGSLPGRMVDSLVPAAARARHAGHRAGYHGDSRARQMGSGATFTALRDDGSQVPVEIGLTPTDFAGQPAVLATILDRSDRVRVEQQQAETERRLRELVEGIPHLVWTSLPDGACDFLSQQWVDYTGIPASAQLGDRWLEQVHPDDRAATMAAWRQVVDSGERFAVEYRLRRHDGAYRWFTTRGVPLRDAGGTITRWFGSSTDVDDQKNLESQLHDRSAALERSNRDLENFAFAASHDLREPLRKIRTFASMLAERIPEGDADALDLIGRIDRSGSRMQSLIEGLLGYARLRNTSKNWEAIALNELVAEVVEDLAIPIRECRAEVSVGALGSIRGDRGQLSSLFQNLVANAIKFRAPGRAPRVGISAMRSGGRVLVDCCDDGVGMTPEQAARAPELFARMHDPARYPGTGLGLATARRIAELHGGGLAIASQLGVGTTVTVSLPEAP